MKQINDRISYIEATDAPLSADIGVIRGKSGTWLYDVGNDGKSILPLRGKYNVVLSHFHLDHVGNIDRVNIDQLYVSKFTHAHVGKGTIVAGDVYADDLHIFPLPSSHAKGCLGLEVGDHAFVGDAFYSKANAQYYIYNAQLLKAEIEVLKKLKARYLLVSHLAGLVKSREEAICELEAIYAQRDKLSSEIFVKR